MNGRDYIISGSCDEHVVCICCAQTGRHLRDISLEGSGSGSMFVQSLRGDSFKIFVPQGSGSGSMFVQSLRGDPLQGCAHVPAHLKPSTPSL
ncbi:protein DWD HYPERSENSITIVE TO UV-B 1-like isoform X2 [Castanea sativa]|uniref:protein DWD HYPERSENSITIVE TO UV-B 1-like isoform X2 n=1 Tax=Castanea sativa TaxID=21020 RepID=UPI003F654045